jgi:endonuclease/exonuclease/phosphatase (EEP) superfamily protein YafD
LFGCLWLTRHKPLILISLFILVIQSSQIVPWYLPQLGFSPSRPANLKILVANLNVQNKSYAKVLSLVRREKPDIALFMEIDQAWMEQLDQLNDVLPYRFGKANPYNLGIAVYSRQQLKNPQFNLFGTDQNIGITGQLTVNQQAIELVGIHPLPPARTQFFHLRNRQLEAVSQYVKTLSNPVVVIGDMNITMWSPYYKRLMNKTGLVNARRGFGIVPSWPTESSFQRSPAWFLSLLSIPIDHCLISRSIRVTNVSTGASTGSDHRPLLVDLSVAR